MTVKIVWYHSW